MGDRIEHVTVSMTEFELRSLQKHLDGRGRDGIAPPMSYEEKAALRRAHSRVNAAVRREGMRAQFPQGRRGPRLRALAPRE